MVFSLEFSTQYRRLEKLEGKMSELLNQKESLQSDYEALQGTNDMLKGMVEEAKRGRALQVQETIKTEMLMGDARAYGRSMCLRDQSSISLSALGSPFSPLD